ncbi:MAG: VWA domain-containing protein [Acidobacteria bacterium]|nr:VWA domain-containing protein [Acidobacteriota bacterium]
MMRQIVILLICVLSAAAAAAQSGHKQKYSESVSQYDTAQPSEPHAAPSGNDEDIIKVETDLVMLPVRVTSRKGRPISDLKQSEFRIYEDGEEQEISFFNNNEAPFTVALLLDMSYSTVFKVNEIQSAALQFLSLLKPDDRVMIVAFDRKVRVLCDVTNNRKALRYAIEGAAVGSGTSVYDALDQVINQRFAAIHGRKAVVLLSDGVDTTSKISDGDSILKALDETDALIYPIWYDTYDDVQHNRRNDAEIRFDEDDRPYSVSGVAGKGERWDDYVAAREFLLTLAERTGGRVQRVSSTTNLLAAFSQIADELRKTYTLGYYPSSERRAGGKHYIRVRVYRPDLIVRAKNSFLRPQKP